jgi:hypothetical protein
VFTVVTLCLGRPVFAEAPVAKAETNLYQEAMVLIGEGRYDEARLALERLVSTEPEHAGAWLDIAMLHCSMGNAREAEALFDSIEARFSPPPGIREVIAQRRALGCKGEKQNVFARLRLGRGFDSNVNQGARSPNFSIGAGNSLINLVLTPEFTPRSDHFTLFSGDFAKALSSSGTLGFVQVQARKYDTLSKYDLNWLLVGIEQPWKVGGWGLRGTGAFGLVTLDGSSYQRQSQLQLYAAPPLSLPTGWEGGIAGGWTNVTYPSLSSFDSQLWESRGMLTYRSDRTFVQASAGYAFDRGSDQRPGNDRSGSIASVTGRLRLAGNILGELSWSLQNWRGKQAYSPGLIDQRREQSTRLWRAAMIFPITAGHALHAEFRDVRNHENISIFEYDGRVFQLSWQWQTGG